MLSSVERQAPSASTRASQLFPFLRRIAAIAAIVVLVAVVFSTLCPDYMRPRTGEPADLERFMAFAALCAGFVFAYPEHWRLIVCLALIGGGVLEAAQNLVPHRHGLLADFEAKAFGSIAGAAIARSVEGVAARIGVTDTGSG